MFENTMARLSIAAAMLLLVSLPAAAQQKPQAAKPAAVAETHDQRMARLGTTEDPGPNPDAKKVWMRFGKPFTIEKFEKKNASFDQPEGFVRPRANINFKREIYQQDDTYVWIWNPVSQVKSSEDTTAAVELEKLRREDLKKIGKDDIKWVKQIVPDFKELEVPESGVTLHFRDSSDGLPKSGSWRNSLAVADMNEDGKADLVIPPPRGSINSAPSIYLGDGQGHWKQWEESSFEQAGNYGSAAVADLNGDGHLDVVLGVHLYGIQVELGNGKGYFTDSSKGLPAGDFPTRRAIIADFNGDGKPDIAAIAEGPTAQEHDTIQKEEKPRLRVFLNDGEAKNWKEAPAAEVGRMLGGDWLVAANLDGDKYPDLAGSSNFFNSPDQISLNDGKKWKNVSRGWMPFYSYYGALTSGRFSGAKGEDLIISYVRIYPASMPVNVVKPPELKEIAGLERVTWGKKGPTRTPILRWLSHKAVWAMGSGDLNGDGNLDVVYSKTDPREIVFLLGDGKGGFKRARFEGLEVPDNITYDIKIADVNQDGRLDVLLMYEDRNSDKTGSVHVYLNEGSAKK